jgi:predicted enzyme related to lactoylglutathione lyase
MQQHRARGVRHHWLGITIGISGASLMIAAAVANTQPPALTTLALRAHHMAKMEAFYAEAFGARFSDVRTGTMTSRFGRIGGLTIKLVPIRPTADFDGFAVHQPGFEVPSIDDVVSVAQKHGGILLHPPTRDGDVLTASIRDPDGNTIELYQRR